MSPQPQIISLDFLILWFWHYSNKGRLLGFFFLRKERKNSRSSMMCAQCSEKIKLVKIASWDNLFITLQLLFNPVYPVQHWKDGFAPDCHWELNKSKAWYFLGHAFWKDLIKRMLKSLPHSMRARNPICLLQGWESPLKKSSNGLFKDQRK